jgi:hypothetical protein
MWFQHDHYLKIWSDPVETIHNLVLNHRFSNIYSNWLSRLLLPLLTIHINHQCIKWNSTYRYTSKIQLSNFDIKCIGESIVHVVEMFERVIVLEAKLPQSQGHAPYSIVTFRCERAHVKRHKFLSPESSTKCFCRLKSNPIQFIWLTPCLITSCFAPC